MIELPSYYILSDEGQSVLPDFAKQKQFNDQGRQTVLHLDANICLDILTFFDGKELSGKSKINVETLILFCQQYKIDIVPKFGIMELCYNRNSQELDILKFQEFVNKITYVFDRPFNETSSFKETKFNYNVEVSGMDISAFETFSPLLLVSYVTLLKIYILCKKNNPQKSNVQKTLKLFLHWCSKYLSASMASEIQLAIKILGGASEFKKMIALDIQGRNLNDVLRPIWGTAWDFFHIRIIDFMSINSDLNYKPYFITQDKNIFKLFKSRRLDGAITVSGNPVMSFLSDTVDVQYKDEYILDDIQSILEEFFNERRSANRLENSPIDTVMLNRLKVDFENDVNKLN